MDLNKIILENCATIDINHKNPSKLCNNVIENNVISDITHEKNTSANVKKIDLSGQYILPRLIENHAHVSARQFDLEPI